MHQSCGSNRVAPLVGEVSSVKGGNIWLLGHTENSDVQSGVTEKGDDSVGTGTATKLESLP